MTQERIAFGLIDTQRGFMPATEGDRLGLPGFGELGVENGEQIIAPLNEILGEFAAKQFTVFSTQDWHPRDTAHFSDTPNFETTWPVHCVMGTPGAEIHPDIEVPIQTRRFVKGFEKLEDGADDTSYSGFNGFNDEWWQSPDRLLKERNVKTLILGGLALDYCVKATALDMKQKAGLDVIIATETTKPVAQETGKAAIAELKAAGIRFATNEEVLEIVRAA